MLIFNKINIVVQLLFNFREDIQAVSVKLRIFLNYCKSGRLESGSFNHLEFSCYLTPAFLHLALQYQKPKCCWCMSIERLLMLYAMPDGIINLICHLLYIVLSHIASLL